MAALFVGTVSFSMAQQGGGQRGGTPEERVQRNIDRLKPLSLTADQEVKIKAILLAQSKSQDSLFAAAGQGADRQATFQKLTPIREASDKKILDLLNEDQKKAYTTMQEQRRQRGPQGGQGGAPRPAGQ